jgi:hypothetical protein
MTAVTIIRLKIQTMSELRLNQRRSSTVTDIVEGPLTRWLFSQSSARHTLWRELDLPIPARIAFELKPPEIHGKSTVPGNIDVLVCHPAKPDRAVVFESKRVKVKPQTFETLLPGKLRELEKKGTRQATGLHEKQFHRNWLLVCVAIDGRERHGKFFSRGLSGPLVKTIYDYVNNLVLRPGVGVVVVEICQPVDDPIEDAGSMVIKVVREPTPQTQPDHVTQWVRSQIGPGEMSQWSRRRQ